MRAAFVTAVCLVGCGTSLELSPGATDSGDDAAVPDASPIDSSAIGELGASCGKPGALACAGHAQRLQLLCDGTKWVANGTCAGQQLCDPRPGPTAGTCQNPYPGCAGRTPGDAFCDDAIRHRCGQDLLDATSATCKTPELCKFGAADKCAVCLPGQHDCDGAKLLVCAPDHLSVVVQETCATPGLCSYFEGVCHAPACSVDQYTCTGDTLAKCNTNRTDFDPVMVCGPGLCDAVGRACFECAPGSIGCSGSTPTACDKTGHSMLLTACSGATPICNAGTCKSGVCSTGDYRCTGEDLEICNATSTGFDLVKTCAPQVCDAAAKDCVECKTGAVGCVGDTPRTCDATHHWTALAKCGGATPNCYLGACTSTPKCNSGPSSAIFYAPVGTAEVPFLPSGMVVSTADETMWRAATTADFGHYQMIVIGSGSRFGPIYPCSSSTKYTALFDTRSTWSAAVTGRIVLDELTAGTSADGSTAGAVTYLRAATRWIATGPGTGLYVATDCGARGFDFMSAFGAFSATTGILYDDAVHMVDPAHPVLAGSFDAMLSGWGPSARGEITSHPAAFAELTADPADPTKVYTVARDVLCIPPP
jgi:hypothetical protein